MGCSISKKRRGSLKRNDERNHTIIHEGKTENKGHRVRSHSDLSQFSTDSRHLVEKGLRLAAFNVRQFGKSKMENGQVVDILLRIVKRYDCILVQEIVDSSGKAINDLLEKVNGSIDSPNDRFELEISPRVGRTKHKEQYAFLYRSCRLQVVKALLFDDEDRDIFIRDPFVVKFKTRCLPGEKDEGNLVFIGIHTQPSNAVAELSALHEVVKWSKSKMRCKNVLIGGDFNAGGSYVTQADWSKIPLRTDTKNFSWLIRDHEDTTATSTLAAYDRIVVSSSLKDMVAHSGVYRFEEDLEIFNRKHAERDDLLLKVSDHYPVEVTLKPKIHTKLQENIHCSSSVTLRDMRPSGFTSTTEMKACLSDLPQGNRVQVFQGVGNGDESFLARVSGECKSSGELISSLKALRESSPQLLSCSLLAYSKFKIGEIEAKNDAGFQYMLCISNETTTIEICFQMKVSKTE